MMDRNLDINKYICDSELHKQERADVRKVVIGLQIVDDERKMIINGRNI